MTFTDIPYAAQIGKLSRPLLDGLRIVLSSIATTWSIEHTDQGAHGAITCTSVTEQGHEAAMGVWVAVPFLATDYGTSGGGTSWTVQLADMVTNRYSVVGNTMTYALWLDTTTVGGTPSYLTVPVPGGYKATSQMAGHIQISDNGTWTAGQMFIGAVYGQIIYLARADNAALAAATNNTYVRGTVTFEVVKQ